MAPRETVQAGVKPRYDGGGDAWALAHRNLGPEFHMHDLDGVFGQLVFSQRTGDRLFLEYVPDNYVNHVKRTREFALVAMFDRKRDRSAALGEPNALSTAFYLWICRKLSMEQPVPAKFFYVIGGQTPPWTMVEVDTATGSVTGREAVIHGTSHDEMMAVWEALGLVELRKSLRAWIDPAA